MGSRAQGFCAGAACLVPEPRKQAHWTSKCPGNAASPGPSGPPPRGYGWGHGQLCVRPSPSLPGGRMRPRSAGLTAPGSAGHPSPALTSPGPQREPGSWGRRAGPEAVDPAPARAARTQCQARAGLGPNTPASLQGWEGSSPGEGLAVPMAQDTCSDLPPHAQCAPRRER